MLALEHARTDLVALPRLVRIGLLVIALGGFADIVAHVSLVGAAGDAGHRTPELSAHLVAFAGMVLVFVGVVLDGVRHVHARRHATGYPSKGGI